MIKGNVIKFGYGDVSVRAKNWKECVMIRNIKPPQECGSYINNDTVEFGEEIYIFQDNSFELYTLMKTVNGNNRIVKFKELTLDFTNYNEDSVKVVRDAAYNMNNISCLAC